MRQFRGGVFVEILWSTERIAQTEAFDMRLFEAPNAVVGLETGHKNNAQDQQNMGQTNENVAMPQKDDYGDQTGERW